MTYTTTHKFLLEGMLLCVAVIVPLSVHAGVFSMFFDTATAETTTPVSYAHDANAQVMPLLKAALHTDPNPAKGGGDIIVEDGVLVPSGDIDGKNETINTRTSNGEISIYKVKTGDTLSEIATMFGVSAKTILWANDISDPSTIRPDTTLVILPITGVRHVVKQGDTVKSIAKKYDGDVDDILAYNQLASAEEVHVGDTIVVPDGTISAPTPEKKAVKGSSKSGSKGGAVATGGGSAGFTNPLPGSVKTQGIHGYNGVDLSGVGIGSPVVAAAGGEVIVAKSSGWNGGYGAYVVIKHPNGTQTLYAHLSSVNVTLGQTVAKGAKIGGMGNSGRSTGPHLHFEVRGARNPF
jgi:murein DD-endopeptidase MepM/ murein hydrolase activator NlpD